MGLMTIEEIRKDYQANRREKKIRNKLRTEFLKVWMEVTGAKRYRKYRAKYEREKPYRRMRNFRPNGIRYGIKMRVINFCK